jgi:hypothetical protein
VGVTISAFVAMGSTVSEFDDDGMAARAELRMLIIALLAAIATLLVRG